MNKSYKNFLKESKTTHKNIAILQQIVDGSSAMPLKFKDGQMQVDVTTANMLLTVHKALKQPAQGKFESLLNTKKDFAKVVSIGWKLVK